MKWEGQKNGDSFFRISPDLTETSVEDSNTKYEILTVTKCNEVFWRHQPQKCFDIAGYLRRVYCFVSVYFSTVYSHSRMFHSCLMHWVSEQAQSPVVCSSFSSASCPQNVSSAQTETDPCSWGTLICLVVHITNTFRKVSFPLFQKPVDSSITFYADCKYTRSQLATSGSHLTIIWHSISHMYTHSSSSSSSIWTCKKNKSFGINRWSQADREKWRRIKKWNQNCKNK
jgi:hypothetical protein